MTRAIDRSPARAAVDRALLVLAVLLAFGIAFLGIELSNEESADAPRAQPTQKDAPTAAIADHPSASGVPASSTPAALSEPERTTANGSPIASEEPAEMSDGGARRAAVPSEPAPPEGTVLVGRFLADDGTPLPDAMAWILRDDESRTLASLRPEKDARFAVAGLPSGRLRMRARADGFLDFDEVLDIPAGAAHVEREFVLARAWTLAVKLVTDDGRPLHVAMNELRAARRELLFVEVDALATTWRPEGDLPPTLDHAAPLGIGRWQGTKGMGRSPAASRIGEDCAGLFDLEEREPLWISAVLRHRVLSTAEVAAGQSEVTLTVSLEKLLASLCTVRLRVVDAASGAPIPEARVGFWTESMSGPGKRVDAEGRIELTDVLPGLLRFEIYAPERTKSAAQVHLEPGQALDLGDVQLFAVRDIEVRCENPIGDASRLSLTALRLDEAAHAALTHTPERMQRSGESFRLKVAEGRYLLRASGAGAGSLVIDTRSYVDRPIVLSLGAEGLLRVHGLADGALVHVSVHDDQAREVWAQWVSSSAPRPAPLPVGTYQAVVTDRAGGRSERTFDLGPEGFDLRVAP